MSVTAWMIKDDDGKLVLNTCANTRAESIEKICEREMDVRDAWRYRYYKQGYRAIKVTVFDNG